MSLDFNNMMNMIYVVCLPQAKMNQERKTLDKFSNKRLLDSSLLE